MCAYVTIPPTPYHHARAPTDTLRVARERHAVLCARPPLSACLCAAAQRSGMPERSSQCPAHSLSRVGCCEAVGACACAFSCSAQRAVGLGVLQVVRGPSDTRHDVRCTGAHAPCKVRRTTCTRDPIATCSPSARVCAARSREQDRAHTSRCTGNYWRHFISDESFQFVNETRFRRQTLHTLVGAAGRL